MTTILVHRVSSRPEKGSLYLIFAGTAMGKVCEGDHWKALIRNPAFILPVRLIFLLVHPPFQ